MSNYWFSYRPAQAEDLEEIMNVLEDRGRSFTDLLGSDLQKETIAEYIRNNKVFVINERKKIAAYFGLDNEEKPLYENSNISWETEKPYIVLRFFVIRNEYVDSDIFNFMMTCLEDYAQFYCISSLRCDTADGDPIKKDLELNGFNEAGTIVIKDNFNSRRTCFEKTV